MIGHDDDTIVAPATAPHPAGVAVIRVSGANARAIVEQFFSAATSTLTKPRTMIYGALRDPETDTILDHCMCCFFKNPHSYTGEDTAEFHLHGSPILVQKLIRLMTSTLSRLALPGEFTRRAFMNGKLDLLQAEAVADVIAASSEQALKLAEEQLSGRFSSVLEDLGEPLRNALAELEAHIDFPEEDIEPDDLGRITDHIKTAEQEIARLLGTYQFGQSLKEGFKVLLYGKPNAGKSSLLNLFLGNDRAIVTEVSGTTRDTLEEAAEFDGYRFIFCDTAGVTDTKDRVEQIGIQRTKERLSWADLILCVHDATDTHDSYKTLVEEIPEISAPLWLLVNKIDLVTDSKIHIDTELPTHYISAETGAGYEDLRKSLIEALMHSRGHHSEASMIVTSERQRACLLRAREYLDKTIEVVDKKLPLEFISADLRTALLSLEDIIGVTSTEDILGRIFSKFCIGK